MKRNCCIFSAALIVIMISLTGCRGTADNTNLSGYDPYFESSAVSQNADLTEQQESEPKYDQTVASEDTDLSQNNRTEEEKTSDTGSAHVHSYTASVKAPTCTSGGYTVYTCECKKSYTGDKTSALGHSFSDWTVTVQPTASAEGTKERKCSRCGYTEKRSVPKTESTESFSKQVVDLVNKERAKAGLEPLEVADDLNGYAYIRSTEITKIFNHQRPDGSNPLDTVLQYGYMSAGENIARGQSSPQAVVTAWMNSPMHKANILNAGYSYIGVGCYRENNEYFWVQIFGG